MHKSWFPLLPGVLCRCGGHSPRRLSMVWHSAFSSFHYIVDADSFQLNGLPYKHTGARWVFLFSCRSRALNNIQNDSGKYHLTSTKNVVLALKNKTFSPCSLVRLHMKRNRYYCAMLKIVLLTVMKAMPY